MPTSPRRIVVTEFVSLDGVIEAPSWTAPYWNDEIAAFKGEEFDRAEALLLGRVTYEMFAAAWPSSPDESAPAMNALGKYVASTTLRQDDLDRIGWNARLLEGEALDAVRALKGAPGGDLLVYGSGEFARALLAHGLVDELRLLVYPVVLGGGARLFGDAPATLDLVEARGLAGGVTALVYRPAAPEATSDVA